MTRVLCSGWRARLWTYQEGTLAKYLHLPVHGRTFTFYHGKDVFLKAIRIRRPRNPIPYLFSISTPDHCTHVVEARDMATGIPWEYVSLDKFKISAILLTDSDISLLVEIICETDGGEILASWKSVVTADKLSDFANIQGFDIAEQNRLEGEYIPFRWWIIE